MKDGVNRRSFMKLAGTSLGIGVLYTVLPMPVAGEAGEMMRFLGQRERRAGHALLLRPTE